MKGRSVIAVCFALAAYVALGGLAFHYLETERETIHRSNFVEYKLAILRNFTCLSEADFENIAHNVISAYNKGILMKTGEELSRTNWDYLNSVFFSSTIVTTIGYGANAPTTTGGRAFCCVYALVGIPICLIALRGVGDFIVKGTNRISDKLKARRAKLSSVLAEGINTALIISISIMLFFLLPAAVFTLIEPWTYGECLYFCFITMTTIGLGDFVPDENSDTPYRGCYRLGVSIWIIIGLSWMSGIISQSQEFFESAVQKGEDNTEDLEMTALVLDAIDLPRYYFSNGIEW